MAQTCAENYRVLPLPHTLATQPQISVIKSGFQREERLCQMEVFIYTKDQMVSDDNYTQTFF